MGRTLWRSVANDSLSSHFTRVGFRFFDVYGRYCAILGA